MTRVLPLAMETKTYILRFRLSVVAGIVFAILLVLLALYTVERGFLEGAPELTIISGILAVISWFYAVKYYFTLKNYGVYMGFVERIRLEDDKIILPSNVRDPTKGLLEFSIEWSGGRFIIRSNYTPKGIATKTPSVKDVIGSYNLYIVENTHFRGERRYPLRYYRGSAIRIRYQGRTYYIIALVNSIVHAKKKTLQVKGDSDYATLNLERRGDTYLLSIGYYRKKSRRVIISLLPVPGDNLKVLNLVELGHSATTVYEYKSPRLEDTILVIVPDNRLLLENSYIEPGALGIRPVIAKGYDRYYILGLHYGRIRLELDMPLAKNPVDETILVSEPFTGMPS